MSGAKYVVRVRQADGSWRHDGELLSKRDAEKAAAVCRIIGGWATNLWPAKELDKIAHEGPHGWATGATPLQGDADGVGSSS